MPDRTSLESPARGFCLRADEVKALRDGRLSAIVRPTASVPEWCDRGGVTCFPPQSHMSFRGNHPEHGPAEKFIKLPLIPGQCYFVRETWQAIHVYFDPETGYGDDLEHAGKVPCCDEGGWWRVVYSATDSQAHEHKDDRGFPWRSPAIMPRWAARYAFEVLTVAPMRVQDLTEEQARALGIDPMPGPVDVVGCGNGRGYFDPAPPAKCVFEDEWGDRYGKRAPWDSNPWTWYATIKSVTL